jgi:hypothetical protein
VSSHTVGEGTETPKKRPDDRLFQKRLSIDTGELHWLAIGGITVPPLCNALRIPQTDAS